MKAQGAEVVQAECLDTGVKTGECRRQSSEGRQGGWQTAQCRRSWEESGGTSG